MVFSTDWWLKRAFKFALKRYLGRLLRSEVDLDQLDVQLGRGTLELRGVLLNCEYLNEQLASPQWEVTAGYVGCMRIIIPLTSLNAEPCSLELEEALLTVQPRRSGQTAASAEGESPSTASANASSPSAGFFDFEDGMAPPAAAITDGVARIAGGIENVLQRLRVQAVGVTVRLELPPPGKSDPASLVVLRLGRFTYAGEAAPPSAVPITGGDSTSMQLQKILAFSGLTVELFEDAADDSAPSQPGSLSMPAVASLPMQTGRVTWADDQQTAPSSTPNPTSCNINLSPDPVVSGEAPAGSDSPDIGSPYASVRSKDAASPGLGSAEYGSSNQVDGWSGDDEWEDGANFAAEARAYEAEHSSNTDSLAGENRHVIICSLDGVGCSGTLQLHLLWQSDCTQRPQIDAKLQLDPLQIQLHPHHLLLLNQLGSYFGENKADALPASRDTLGASAMRASQTQASRSFLADILIPDTRAVALDFLEKSWQQDKADPGASAADSEYHDADSLLGSIRSGLTSFVSASASGVAQGASYFSAASGLDGRMSMAGSPTHPPPGAGIGSLKLELETSELSLVLWYPEEETCSHPLGDLSIHDYRPRLSVEVGDVTLDVSAPLHEGCSAKVNVYRVEAVEHLPAFQAESSLSSTALAETMRVPEALPAVAGGERSVPSFGGVCISPMRKSIYASMLSQVSSLTASMGPLPIDGPQVQIWPVLCVAGGRKRESSSPSMQLSVDRNVRRMAGLTGEQESPVKGGMSIRPTTLWLSMPFIERLHTFLEPLILQLAAEALGRSSVQQVSGQGKQAAAVSLAINSILDDLHSLDSPPLHEPGSSRPEHSFKLALDIAHFCAIFSIPQSSGMRTSLAVDLFSKSDHLSHTLTLMNSQRTPASQPVWDAAVSFTRAKAYLVQAEDSPYPGSRNSHSATCVMDVLPVQAGKPNAAITLDIRWKPGVAQSVGLADMAWEWAQRRKEEAEQGKGKTDSGSALEHLQLQDAASSDATLSLHILAPDICFDLSQADLAVLWSLVAALIRWQTETTAATALSLGITLPFTETSPAVLDLECSMRCNLKPYTQGADICMDDRRECIFQVDACDLHIFAASGLDCNAASIAAAVQASRLRVVGERNQAVLLSCGHSPAGLDFLHIQRQLAPGNLAAEALACLAVQGTTISTEPGDLTFTWFQRLAGFFAVPTDDEAPADEMDQPPVPCLWDVQLDDCAVRDEPAEASEGSIAAALLVGGLHWQTPSVGSKQVINITNLSLLAAEACSRSECFAASEAVDLPNSRLLDDGYVCLAQEGGLSLALQPPPEGDSTGGEESIYMTELSNRRLHCPLTKAAWQRLNALFARWSLAFDSGEPPARQDMEIPDADEQPSISGASLGVAVMAGVDEDAFSSRRSSQRDKAAAPLGTAYVDENFYLPVPVGDLDSDDEADVPGGAPVIIEDLFKDRYRGAAAETSRQGNRSEGGGIWYDGRGEESAGPINVLEEYVKRPPPGYVPESGHRCALGPLAEGYATPLTRFTLRDFRLVIALCHAVEPEQGGSMHQATTPKLQLELEDLCLQVDVFGTDSPHARRLALSVRGIELRDCCLKPDASPAWAKVFSQHISARSPRGPSACLLTLELESVRPDSGNEELRLKLSSLPIRLRIDQDVVIFLQDFFTISSSDKVSAATATTTADPIDAEPEPASKRDDQSAVFFQKCEIMGIAVVVDYKPRRLDVVALRAGNLAEVLNITAWSNVAVQLPHVRLTGVHGWDALGSMLAQRYLNNIASSQVHSFIAGIKPIQSIIRIGAAAGQLLAIPAEALRGRPDSAYSGRTPSAVPISRQIQRGVFGLVRAIMAEALGMGAGALGGIHLVLAGPSAAVASTSQQQPSNVTEGMRQAADRLSSGFGEMGAALKAPFRSSSIGDGTALPEVHGSGGGIGRATVKALRAAPGALAKPLSGGAAAARCALLGAKNALEPERYENKRLGR